ncbi:MAG: tol-pal system protein YbgF [Deltaproteobacteria bacterium]|nr:tol-pal system protein YbgF [Deltaproteobacteria bacterium]
MERHSLSLPLLFLSTLLFLLSGCVSQDAKYIRRDINTLQKQIDSLQEEIRAQRTPVSPQPAAAFQARKAQADVEVELENLKRDLISMRAGIEDNQNLVARISKRLDDFEKDFEMKISAMEAKLDQLAVAAEAAGETPAQPPPPSQEAEPLPAVQAKQPLPSEGLPGKASPDVEKRYQEAYQAFKEGNLDEAKKLFLSFLKDHPDTPLSDNAQFWIGEIAYRRHQYEAAILAYEEVIKKHPDSNKLPDAILKQGLAFLELGDRIDARIILQDLVKKYPKTEQAEIARKKLKTLK